MLLVTPAVLGLSIASVYAEEEKRIEIMVEKNNDDDAQVEVLVNGDAEKFVLPELAEGESRTLITEAGNTIVATKTDGKTLIKLDGEELVIMAPHQDMGADFSFISDDEHHQLDDNKIIVIGGNLSDEVRAALQNTLNAYSSDKELVFPETNSGNRVMLFGNEQDVMTEIESGQEGKHKEIKIIRKRLNKEEK